jgi:hypothetical protein
MLTNNTTLKHLDISGMFVTRMKLTLGVDLSQADSEKIGNALRQNTTLASLSIYGTTLTALLSLPKFCDFAVLLRSFAPNI